MTDTKPDSRERRFGRRVKRAMQLIGAAVFLCAWYLLSFGALQWYAGHDDKTAWQSMAGRIGGSGSNVRRVANQLDATLYAPVHGYALTEWPGARLLAKFKTWCYANGLVEQYVSWGDLREDGQIYVEVSETGGSIWLFIAP